LFPLACLMSTSACLIAGSKAQKSSFLHLN
jgi:hypothetical protein